MKEIPIGKFVVALLFESIFNNIWACLGVFGMTFAIAASCYAPGTLVWVNVPTMIRNSKTEGYRAR